MRWRTPRFWSWPEPSWQARLLFPFGWLYGAITATRMNQIGEAATLPIICIGNVTAGGAGKTPTTLAIAAMLKAHGAKVAIISRGYGGTLKGPVLINAASHSAADVGDEPLMMATITPVIVAKNRPSGAALAAKTGMNIALMDDGLQNPSLIKNISIAVVDGAIGIGNGYCLPAGPLRAPMAAQWPHIDIMIVIGEGQPGLALAQQARVSGKLVFTAHLEPDADVAACLKGKRVLALAGIGRPQKFVETLTHLGADVAETEFFADHHLFTARELVIIASKAKATQTMVVTTQKDAARIKDAWNETQFGAITILPVHLKLDDESGLMSLLERLLQTS